MRQLTSFKLTVLFVIALPTAGCRDKAQDGFARCQQLLASGKLQEAAGECEGAHNAAPQSPFGIKSAELKAQIDEKIDNIIPPVVDRTWCARLASHLEPILLAQAQQKYPNHDPGFITQSIHGNVENTEYDCRQDAGKPTAGLWVCRWNETIDTADQCDKLESHPHAH